MKGAIIAATLFGMLALMNAKSVNKRSPNNAPSQYSYFPTHKQATLEEDLGSDTEDDKLEAMLSSIKDDIDGNGERILMAAMMGGDKEQAVAQNLLRRLENTFWGRFIIRQIRQRYCRSG